MLNAKQAAEKHRQLIIDTLDYIWANPETGYREVKTSAYLENVFEKLGYDIVKADNIPGFYTVIDTGREGPELLIMGELDSLICREHPDADKETGAVHCCGHAAQCAALVGIAAALKEPGALDALSGRIRLCAVPAEELLEIDFRKILRDQGTIKYFGGKPEFLRRGYFDGVDLAFMVHTTINTTFGSNLGSVGCMAKKVIYKGRSSHAGGSPWNGINALYAANLGLSAINSIRETFKEADTIRVHPIITVGGGAVNAIPDKVVLESFVRGMSFEAIAAANKKVNRALIGGAVSLGANIEIIDIPGYSPLKNDTNLLDVAAEAAKNLDYPFNLNKGYSSGSTDMADLSQVMPVIHPYAPGAVGNSHGSNYFIENPDLACVGSAAWQLEMINILLSNSAEVAKKVVAEYKAPFASNEEFFAYLDAINDDGERIVYKDDGTAEVRL